MPKKYMIPLFSLAVDFLFMLLFNFKKKKKTSLKIKILQEKKRKKNQLCLVFLFRSFVCNVTLNLKILLPLCMQDRDGQAIILALRSISKGEEVCLCLYLIALFFFQLNNFDEILYTKCKCFVKYQYI